MGRKSIGTENVVSPVPVNSKNSQPNVVQDDDDVVKFGGKKKSNSKKGGKKNRLVSGSGFGLLGDEDIDDTSNFGLLGDLIDKSLVSEQDSDDNDEPVIAFTGKKKPSKSNKKSSASVFSVANLDELDEDIGDLDEDASKIMFSGKKTEPPSAIVSGKDTSSKNKKKKKKSGRTAQEEDDLDKLLAELGEGPTHDLSVQEKVEIKSEPAELVDDAGEKDGEEEIVESAAAKKKKKKKEKEKEKKAAAAKTAVEEKQEDSKAKVPDKKVPKHVREMHERLARLKEAEEKKKREEEEKLRKEEEERCRQEELERLAEEKKRLKKEREKEKLLKKKAEGKLLIGKQKEEARRREAMRNQILANAGGLLLPTGATGAAPTKRPKYQTIEEVETASSGQWFDLCKGC